MSPIREAHATYYDNQREAFIVFISPRRVNNSNKIAKHINIHISDMWDKKLQKEALYASSEDERFKQDVLPDIIKKLEL